LHLHMKCRELQDSDWGELDMVKLHTFRICTRIPNDDDDDDDDNNIIIIINILIKLNSIIY
jgi:hypothetical protein